jgi:hypothetical protein
VGERRDPETRTDASGAGAITGLAAGSYELRVLADGCPWADRQIDLAPGEHARADVVVQPGLTISGRVRPAEGGLLDSADPNDDSVSARQAGVPTETACSDYSSVDARGRFAIRRLLPGVYDLYVSIPGYEGLAVHDIAAGTKGLDLVVKQGRPPSGVVRGRVVDAHGAPVEGASLMFDAAEPDDDYWRESPGHTDHLGHFRLDAQTGPGTLRAFKDGWRTAEVSITVPQDCETPEITITLERAP